MKKSFHLIWIFLLVALLVLDESLVSASNSADTPLQNETAPVLPQGIAPSALQAQAAAAGKYFSCALTPFGGVMCWGYGLDGQLGNGQALNQSFPVSVMSLSSGVTAVSTGDYHACARTAAGGVKCWGSNSSGQLGIDAATASSSVPVDVQGLTSGVAAVSAGGDHTCVLMAVGGVKCWGNNFNGQLGTGSPAESSSIPQDVAGLTSGVLAVSAGVNHTCALTTGGGLKCWGSNSRGQLGVEPSTGSSGIPLDVQGLASGVTAVSAGWSFTCAVVNGGVKCWGSNFQSQLGSDNYPSTSTPTDVIGLSSGVTAVSAGGMHACALTSAGGVKCWGNGPQLGDGIANMSAAPVDVVGLAGGISRISAGYNHTCAVTLGGVQCWGINEYSQLGTGPDAGFITTPQDVVGLASGALALSTGSMHTCALTSTGGVKCWGQNSEGQVGDGTTIHRSTPVDVSGLSSGVRAVSAGKDFTCALTDLGAVVCWGLNSSGQLGDGTTARRTEPVAVTGLPAGVTAISAGGYHACALDATGGVWCWGENSFSQLGDGTTEQSSGAVQAANLVDKASAIGAGAWHTCALTLAGGLKCWGRNNTGQLGNGTWTDSPTPLDVTGLTSGVLVFGGGSYHNCALSSGGAISCWGFNGSGRLGNGNTASQSAPAAVAGFAGLAASVGAGDAHTCATTTTGGVQCWGANGKGQLGDGTVDNRLAPVQVAGLSAGVAVVDPGSEHTCALTTAGGVKCWGSNAYGQSGYKSLWVPVDVVGQVLAKVYLPLASR
jgi:alpha-tubulin suppressor-like RCC1 family protein